MSLWDLIRGTYENIFQIGKGGPQLKNDSGAIDVRDATDANFTSARAGVASFLNLDDLRSWRSFSRAFFVDPAAGNDANPGTALLPFRTWNGGVWPSLLQLRYCDVTVTYVNTTVDTSLGGLMALPPGVRVTISAPWVDVGLGVQTATAGSNSTVTVGGAAYAVNAYEGSRLRWVSSASGMTGQVYVVPRNTSTQFQGVGGAFNMTAAAAANDTFVIERPQGGWRISSNFVLDATAPGSAFVFKGFRWSVPGGTILQASCLGNIQASGLTIDGQASVLTALSFAGSLSLGEVGAGRAVGFKGKQIGVSLARGTDAELGFYAVGNNNFEFALAGAFLWCLDVVFTDVVVQPDGGSSVVASGWDMHGTTPTNGLQLSVSTADITNFTQQGVAGNDPVQVTFGSSLQLSTASFDTANVRDCIVVDSSYAWILQVTGGGSAAGRVGVSMVNGARVTNLGGNTVSGGDGGVKVGADAAQAWPAAGTLVTDFTSAIITAGTCQGCVLS